MFSLAGPVGTHINAFATADTGDGIDNRFPMHNGYGIGIGRTDFDTVTAAAADELIDMGYRFGCQGFDINKTGDRYTQEGGREGKGAPEGFSGNARGAYEFLHGRVLKESRVELCTMVP